MNALIFAAATGFVLSSLPSIAGAACAAPSVRVNTKAALSALLTGNTVCVPAMTQPTMEAQELHQAGGALIDFKRGPGHPVDPSTRVGSWAVTGTDGRGVFVTHTYSGGQAYTYAVWRNVDSTHSFCSANPEIQARVKTGGGPC